MSKSILLFLLIMLCKTLNAFSSGNGINSDKIILCEYLKVVNGEIKNEFMIYNPTKEKIKVYFIKHHFKREHKFINIYSESDVLMETKVRGNQYILFENLNEKITDVYKGPVKVFVDDELVGMYNFIEEDISHSINLDNGIIFYKSPNTGSILGFYIVYERLEFGGRDYLKTNVQYRDNDFYSSGFTKGEKYNPDRIVIVDYTFRNLKLMTKENFDLLFSSVGIKGEFTVKFNLNKKRPRIMKRVFNHMINLKTGGAIIFIIPNKVNFNARRKYRSTQHGIL